MIIDLGEPLTHKYIDKSALLDAEKRFLHLMDVERKLNIINNDVKIRNMILVDNKVQVIDISYNHFSGTHGKEGRNFAEALFTAFTGIERAHLKNVYSFYNNPSNHKLTESESAFEKNWIKFVCENEKSASCDDTDVAKLIDKIKNAEDIFDDLQSKYRPAAFVYDLINRLSDEDIKKALVDLWNN